MQIYESTALDVLEEKARSSPRQRAAQALKPYDYTGVRPLLNAMLKGTYIQPHRHTFQGGDESWYVLRGAIAPFTFDEEGNITDKGVVSSGREIPFVHIPEGEFHTLVVVSDVATILEFTKGPYVESTYKEFAQWAPSEAKDEEENAKAYLRNLEGKLK